MAVTITDLRAILNEADATTSWTGSNSITLFTTGPTPIESTGCLGMVVSNTTEDAYLTVSSTDYTAGNTPGPSIISFWIFHRAELDTTANGGIAIQLGDGTNRVAYHVAGSDVDGFRHSAGPVGWQNVLIDTANLPSSTTTLAGSAASLNFAAITQIGVMFKTLVKAVGGVDNCFWDICRENQIGEGLRISGGTGGSPGLLSEVATADRGTGNQQAYGVVRELGTGLYGCQSALYFGDSGTGNNEFNDSNVTLAFEDRLVDTDKYLVQVDGNSTGTNNWTLTNATISVPSSRSASFDATDVNLDLMSATAVQFVGFDLGCDFSADATLGPDHDLTNCTFRGCGQVNTGRVPTTGTTFTEAAAAATSAMIWNANISISGCSFTNNTAGTDKGAIEHPAAGTFGYNNLTFSGNTYDIINSTNATTADSYPDSNQDSTQNLGDGTTTGVGQSFTNASAGVISNARFDLSITGSPTGNIRAVLYALSGAIGGGDDVPTGAALAASDDVDVSTLTGTLTVTQFNFSDNISMSASTDYFIAVEESTSYSGDGANHVNVGTDTSSPTHSGNMATESGTWTASSGTDVIFFVSRGGYVIIQASNGANPGTYLNTGSPPGGVRIENGVTVSVTVRDEGGTAVQNAGVYVQLAAGPFDDTNQILRAFTNASGLATTSYNYTGDVSVVIRVRKKGFVPFDGSGTITANGLSASVRFIADPNVE